MTQYKITYLSNSGFLLELGRDAFVFDYQGDCPELLPADLLREKEHAVFCASHSHYDHYSPKIFDYEDLPGVSYLLSSDIRACRPKAVLLSPGESAEVSGARFTAYASTDLGISLLLEKDGLRIFHAGDLNSWHWRDESTPEEAREAQHAYEAVLDTLSGPFDLAFFPVDPRLGTGYAQGAEIFLDRFAVRFFIPMHFREATYAARDFAVAHADGPARILPLTKRGQTYGGTL